MNKLIVLAILLLSPMSAAIYGEKCFTFAERRGDSLTGSAFVKAVETLDVYARDSLAYREITAGNIPDWLKTPVAVADTLYDAYGQKHEVTFYVLPDFLAIGDDEDFFRVPMMPITAQKIADHYNAVLANRKLSNIIHRHSEVKMTPHPMTPDATMTTVPVFARHDSIIEAERRCFGKPSGVLIAGHKKDIILSNRIEREPGRLLIYGWHYPDGKPIQQITSVHHDRYVDYSHGVRLVSDFVIVDGKECSMKALLRDNTLYALFSDEEGPMKVLGYNY